MARLLHVGRKPVNAKRNGPIIHWGELGRTPLLGGLVLALLAALAFGVMALSGSDQPASAYVAPDGCNADLLSQGVSRSPVGPVNHGDKLTYTVTYTNPSSGSVGQVGCNITALDAFLVLPNGTSIQVLTAQTLNAGAASITCPGDAACKGPAVYTYTVAHGDELGLPPSVTASFEYDGILHDSNNHP